MNGMTCERRAGHARMHTVATVLCIASMLAYRSAMAGAWTSPAGSGDAFLNVTSTSNDRYFGDRDNMLTGRTYRKAETQLRIEYGITDAWTVFADTSLLHTTVGGDGGGSYTGFGYTELGMRRRVYTNGIDVFSVEATARVPGAPNSGDPAEVGYTGVEYDLRALYGRGFSLGNWPAFVDAEAAWRVRNGASPGEYRLDLTLGARPAVHWLAMLQSFNVISNGSGSGVFDVPYRYYKIQPSVVWEFAPAWSWQLGAVATIAGRNSWREQGVVTGLWHRF